jgi:biopolymer transport protein ExbD
MIDIVFLLLVFFILTFRVVAPEGDFLVEMPQAAAADTEVRPPDFRLPLVVRLTSTATGELSGITLNGRRLADMQELREAVQQRVDESPRGDELEIVLDCDEALNYRHTIDAVTAVRGYIAPQGGVVPLVKNIRIQ